MKLGKKPASPRAADFKLGTVLAVPLPKTPGNFGFGTLYAKDGSGWEMLGNDRYGDCVFAGAAHETMLWNKVAQHSVEFDDRAVLADYAAVTGFDPRTGSNDNGTDVHDAMSYRRITGVADKNGVRHKIDAYVSIDPKDWETMVRATYVFGAVGIGFEFPDYAMRQFEDGQPWDYLPNEPAPVDGHYVCAVGTLHAEKEVSTVSWSQRQRMTKSFYEAYNDETWVPLSFEVVRRGFGLRHLDESALRDLIAGLGTPNA